MKIYKISFRNQLDLLSQNISGQIMDDIKNKILNNQLNDDIFAFYVDKIEIKFILNVSEDSGYMFDMVGRTDTDKKETEIESIVNKNLSQKDFDAFYRLLVSTVRHELNHLYEEKSETDDENYPVNDFLKAIKSQDLNDRAVKMRNYLLDKSEVEAYVRAIMIQCKKSKGQLKFSKELDRFVDRQLYGSFVKSKYSTDYIYRIELIKEHIKQIYMNSANLIYGNVL